MYAVDNVKKFVDDHASELGERGPKALARAELVAENGMFSGGIIGEVMGNDPDLTARFESEANSNPEHIRIGHEALVARR
ncbi:MAG: hypothetical protein AAB638_02280 [Patescibacteria group bacterium]